MERLYAITDGIVLVFGLLLLAALVGVFGAIGIIVFLHGGTAAGIAALIPIAILAWGMVGAFHSWYRAL